MFLCPKALKSLGAVIIALILAVLCVVINLRQLAVATRRGAIGFSVEGSRHSWRDDPAAMSGNCTCCMLSLMATVSSSQFELGLCIENKKSRAD